MEAEKLTEQERVSLINAPTGPARRKVLARIARRQRRDEEVRLRKMGVIK